MTVGFENGKPGTCKRATYMTLLGVLKASSNQIFFSSLLIGDFKKKKIVYLGCINYFRKGKVPVPAEKQTHL